MERVEGERKRREGERERERERERGGGGERESRVKVYYTCTLYIQCIHVTCTYLIAIVRKKE